MSGSVIALDVGGTSMKGAVLDAELEPRVWQNFPTPAAQGPAAVVAAIADAAVELAEQAANAGFGPVRAAGVGVPGVVDDGAGVAVFAANLGWRDVPLAALLGDRLGVPVRLGHDIRLGAVAEAAVGSGQGVADLLFVTLGTGIGGAAVVDGRLLVAGGYAAELGHLQVDPAGPECGCGGRGCLEGIASASAITRTYAQRSGQPVPGASAVAAAVRAGDAVAEDVWSQATDALARAFVAAVTLFGSELILVGGGLAESGDLLLDPVRARVAERLTFQRPPTIARPALADRAGCVGAGVLAWRQVGEWRESGDLRESGDRRENGDRQTGAS